MFSDFLVVIMSALTKHISYRLLLVVLIFSTSALICYMYRVYCTDTQKVRFVATSDAESDNAKTANWKEDEFHDRGRLPDPPPSLKSTTATTFTSATTTSIHRRKLEHSQLLRKDWQALSRRTTEHYMQTRKESDDNHLTDLTLQEADAYAFEHDLKKCSLAMGVSLDSLQNATESITTISKKARTFLRTIWSFVPQNFSHAHRNPCWYADIALDPTSTSLVTKIQPEQKHSHLSDSQISFLSRNIFHNSRVNRKQLVCLPYFFIAGFPKSGTTSLHQALSRHPQIVGPLSKEPHWWTRIPLQDLNSNYIKLTVVRYLLHFLPTSKSLMSSHTDIITYDASQSTLWDSNFFTDGQDYCAMPAIISRVLPNAKFIVLMRKPTTRVYSHFLWECSRSFGSKDSLWPVEIRSNITGFFHRAVVTDLQYLQECLGKKSLYECTNLNRYRGWVTSNEHSCTGAGYKLTVGLYYVHLAKWLQFYGKEQFLFLRMEDMENGFQYMITKIIHFLGIDRVSPQQVQWWFEEKANAWKANYPKMNNETRILLDNFYRPYNKMLSELVGDSRFLWDDSS